MAELTEKIENLKEVIEKNKEKFSMQDCHNFVAYFNSIKKEIKSMDDKIKADNNRHIVIQEVIAKSHNASIEKITELKESVEVIKINTTKIHDEVDTKTSDLEQVKSKCSLMEEKLINLEEKLNKNSKSVELLQKMINENYQGVIQVIQRSHATLVQHNAIIGMSIEKLLNDRKDPHTLHTIQETSDEEKGSSDGEVVNELTEEVIEEDNNDQEVSDNEEEESDEETDESEDEEEKSHPNVTLEVSDK